MNRLPGIAEHNTSSLRRIGGPDNAVTHLVCFPWAGAGATAYRPLAKHLPSNVAVWAVQYPGREDRLREVAATEMRDLVTSLTMGLHALCGRPVVFFGHSMGSLVAFEVARRLRTLCLREPYLIVASGSMAPHLQSRHVRPDVGCSDDKLILDLVRLRGTPDTVLSNPSMMKILLPILRADYTLLDGYQCAAQPAFDMPLIACAGRGDHSVSEAGLSAWGIHTKHSTRVEWFTGDHFYPRSEPAQLGAFLGGLLQSRNMVAASSSLTSGPIAALVQDEFL